MIAKDVTVVIVVDSDNNWLCYYEGNDVLAAIRQARVNQKKAGLAEDTEIVAYLATKEVSVSPGEEV